MKTISRLLACACCLTTTLLIAAPSTATQPLTNEDIVKLSSLGLGDEVTIAKIKQASEVSFSLEIADLEKLTKNGVSKSIIAAMLQRTTRVPTGNSATVSIFDVWAVANEKQIEIPGVSGYTDASVLSALNPFSFKNKMAISTRGTKAATRFATPPSTIWTRYKPSEIGVVRFTIHAAKDKRYVTVVTRVGSNAGEFDPPKDDIKFTEERSSDGAYKLTFNAPLQPGEYALIAYGGNTGYLVHDFAIDADPREKSP